LTLDYRRGKALSHDVEDFVQNRKVSKKEGKKIRRSTRKGKRGISGTLPGKITGEKQGDSWK